MRTATDRLHSKLDSSLPQIKRQLMKAMHSPHGLDVAGFIKRHDHELSGCVCTCAACLCARTRPTLRLRSPALPPRFPRSPRRHLTFDEFATQCKHLCKIEARTMKKLIKRVDVDGKGYIDAEDLAAFLDRK